MHREYLDYIPWGFFLSISAVVLGMILPWVAGVRKLVGLDRCESLGGHVDPEGGTLRIAGQRKGRVVRFDAGPDGIRTEEQRLLGARMRFVPAAAMGGVTRGRIPIGAPILEHVAQLMLFAGIALMAGFLIVAGMKDGGIIYWILAAVWAGGVLQVIIHLIMVISRNRESVAVLVRDRNGAILTGFGFTTPVYALHPAFTETTVEQVLTVLERMCGGGGSAGETQKNTATS